MNTSVENQQAIIKRESTRSELRRRIRDIQLYIDENLNGNLEIKSLSCMACMSEYHFIRIFNELCGCTPYQFIIKKRIARAKTLLLGSSLSVGEISQACGYESVQTFRKCFKRETGYSPREFHKYQRAVA